MRSVILGIKVKMRKRNIKNLYKYGLVLHKETKAFKNDLYKRIGLKKLFFKKKILDLGCGHGTDAILLEKFASRVTGVDISKYKEWELLRTKKIKYVKANSSKLPFKDNTFDGVYLKDLLHHINDINGTLNEIKRVTKSDGKIVILEGNRYNPVFFIYVTLLRGHDHFTQKEFIKQIKAKFTETRFAFLEAYPPFRFPMSLYRIIISIEKNINKLTFLNPLFAYNIAFITNKKPSRKYKDPTNKMN